MSLRAPTVRPGRFIVLDGPDGVGKSTQVARLAGKLKRLGLRVLAVREPGGTAAGEGIRRLLLHRHDFNLTAVTEALLFQAARAQLVAEVIRPALAAGTWVLCDRFTLSTRVYQGAAGGMRASDIETLGQLATGGLRPDLYLVFWAPARRCRLRNKERSPDRMESKGARFLGDVVRGYRDAARAEPRRYILVDASGTRDEVAAAVWERVLSLMGTPPPRPSP